MNNNVIYRARFQSCFNKYLIWIGIIFAILFLLGTIPYSTYDSYYKGKYIGTFYHPRVAFFEVDGGCDYAIPAFFYGLLYSLPAIICCLSPIIYFYFIKFIASRCSLCLEEGQIKGQLKTLFGKKSLQLPLDHLDNVMVSHGLMDKLCGGKTLLISSNRGLIKFHYVQNADEFARVAMEKIEEVKKKTFHNPAPAPTAAPTQSTGNDTMEKLNSLKKMLENGLITQEEFEVKRKELLEKL